VISPATTLQLPFCAAFETEENPIIWIKNVNMTKVHDIRLILAYMKFSYFLQNLSKSFNLDILCRQGFTIAIKKAPSAKCFETVVYLLALGVSLEADGTKTPQVLIKDMWRDIL
jgi:hypothetical protein